MLCNPFVGTSLPVLVTLNFPFLPFSITKLFDGIAEAHMSLLGREEGISTIFSLFPATNSLSDSSDSSLSNRTLQHLSPYSITSFFPPYNFVSSSVSTQTIHFPLSISSLFSPTQSLDSQLNSLCSSGGFRNFSQSVP